MPAPSLVFPRQASARQLALDLCRILLHQVAIRQSVVAHLRPSSRIQVSPAPSRLTTQVAQCPQVQARRQVCPRLLPSRPPVDLLQVVGLARHHPRLHTVECPRRLPPLHTVLHRPQPEDTAHHLHPRVANTAHHLQVVSSVALRKALQAANTARLPAVNMALLRKAP